MADTNGHTRVVDYYTGVVLLAERLDAAFPEFGWRRDARARRALDEGLRNVRPGVKLDKLGYVVHLEDNLLPGITRAQIEDAFGAGAGQELEGKMRAPWSSSALAVNSFAPWQHDPGVLTVAGISGFTKTLAFEAQCPNGDPASSRCPA